MVVSVVSDDQVWEALASVPDPELPALSLVDLGVVRSARVEGGRVRVELVPTFLGCPAMEEMRRRAEAALHALGCQAEVVVVDSHPWSTDCITPEGREKLRRAGLGPPRPGPTTLAELRAGSYPCPHCGSPRTRLDNLFGPTPCRSIRYCPRCRQPFEQIKTL